MKRRGKKEEVPKMRVRVSRGIKVAEEDGDIKKAGMRRWIREQ